MNSNRWWVLGLGVFVLVLAIMVPDVVAALTIAYDILVGGLLVAILGGVYANEPIYIGLAASAVVYVVVSLLTRPTHPSVLEAWRRRRTEGATEELRPGVAVS